jgi:hypothetical protein
MAAKTSNPIGKGAVDALGAAQVGLAEISSYELAPDSRPRHLWPDADESTRTAIGKVIARAPERDVCAGQQG